MTYKHNNIKTGVCILIVAGTVVAYAEQSSSGVTNTDACSTDSPLQRARLLR
jgi:hypothetical protein